MDVWRITVAAVRRWYVLLPLLGLSVLASLSVGERVPTQFEVAATIVLVPGRAESEVESPYGTMNSTNQVLSIVLNNSTSRSRIEEQGLDANYRMSSRSNSRLMDFEILTDSPEVGLATAEAVLEMAREEIATRQEAAGVEPDARIGIQVLQAPSVAEEVTQGRTRGMVIVGVAGAVLSILVTVLLDDIVGLLRRWSGSWRRSGAVRPAGAHQQSSQGHELSPDAINTPSPTDPPQTGVDGAGSSRRGGT
jgi:hypothetical protein